MTVALSAAVLDALARVHGDVLDVTPLEGGLSNRSFRVRTSDGSDLAVRLPAEPPTRLDLGAEIGNALAAAAAGAGVAPTVDDRDFGAGVLVTHFVEGSPLQAGDLRNPHLLTRVASLLRQLHSTAAFAGHFDLAASRRAYVADAAATGVQLPSWYADLAPTVEAMEDELLEAEPLVASHNDLVPANIVDAGGRCWLIDFEYSAPNVAGFDLGTLIAAGGLAREATDHLVSTYWGRPCPTLSAQARAWSLIQRYSYLPWARLQPAEVRRNDPSRWAEGGPNGLAELRLALTGSGSGVLGGAS